MAFVDIPREVVYEWVQDAREEKIKRAVYVRDRVNEEYPEFAKATIKRGPDTVNALDYLISDLDSYA